MANAKTKHSLKLKQATVRRIERETIDSGGLKCNTLLNADHASKLAYLSTIFGDRSKAIRAAIDSLFDKFKKNA